MKSPLLLSSAALLAMGSSAAVDPGAAAASQAARAGAGAAQQDQIAAAAAAAPAEEFRRASASSAARAGLERPEDIVFKFTPPATTRRAGHPEDPDLKLTESDIRQLDEIGGKLVDFVDSADRIEKNRSQHEEKLLKERGEQTKEADKALVEARDKRIAAGGDYADAQGRHQTAKAQLDMAKKELDQAKKVKEDLEAKLNRDYKEIGDKNRAIEATRREKKAAIDAETRAKAAEGKASAALSAAQDAVAVAQRGKADAESAVSARQTEAESAAAEAKSKAESAAAAAKTRGEKNAEADSARENAVAEASAARDKAKETAVSAVAAADRDAAAAAAARKAFERAEKKALVAERTVTETEKDAKEAKAAYEARRPKEGEKQGFFGRWATRRAERRAAAAQKAFEAAAAAAPVAKAEAEKAKGPAETAAKAAEKSAETARQAEEALRKSAENLASVRKAQDETVRKVRAEQDEAVAKAEGEAKRAESAKAAADRAFADAKKASEKAAERAIAAENAVKEATESVGSAVAAAKAAGEEIKRLDGVEKQIAAESDARVIANLRMADEKGASEGRIAEKQQTFDDKDAVFKEIDKVDLGDKKSVYENAGKEEERAREAHANALRSLNAVHGDAYYEAMKDEKRLEKENQDAYDSFWNQYRANAVDAAAGIQAQALENAKSERDTKREEAKAAAERAVAARSAEQKAKEALRASRGEKKGEGAADAENDATGIFQKAVAAREQTVGEAKAAEDAARAAERKVARAQRALDEAGRDAGRAVDRLKAAFDEQVAMYQLRKRNAVNWILMDESARIREKARQARLDYLAARKALDRSRKALSAERARFARGAIQWNTDAFAAARADYRAKRSAFETAEDAYNEYFSDSHVFATAPLTDEQADALLDSPEVRRLFPKDEEWRISGDRRWLARTSVNGEPLLDTFVGEMEEQAEQLVDKGEAQRDEMDQSRVLLTHDQAAKCAEEAVKYVRRRAIYGGFYFAGLEVDAANNVVFVDKGRYGPITVEFRDRENNLLESGRVFSTTNVLDKLGASARTGAFGEGEAFNFNAFRARFRDFNANPDVTKADVAFKLLPENYDYGYEDEDEAMGTNRTTRAVAAAVTVQEKPWPAPLHGSIGVDNFNSMGESDKPMGEADTWMARATLQTLDLWGLGHALTLSGNYSLGGSLFGGAAGYFIPRADDGTWADGSWSRLSGWSWTVHGGYTDVDQKDVVPSLDVLGTGLYAGVMGSSRMADFGGSTLDFSLGLTWRRVENSVKIDNQEIKLGPGGDPYTIIPLTAALLYADKDLDSMRGRNYATLELSYNLGGSSAEDLSVFRSAIDDDKYFLARLQLARLQLMWEDSTTFIVPRMAFLRADAQWASTPVIGAEQYGVGGHSTVRGYVERQFMGDSGASGTVELRSPLGLGLLDRSGWNAADAADRIQFVYFFDIGWYELDNGSAAKEDDIIYSVGLGLRYSYDDLVLRFDWGVPLVRDDKKYETSSAGVGHASLNYQF